MIPLSTSGRKETLYLIFEFLFIYFFNYNIVQFYDPVEEVNYNKQKPPLVIYEGCLIFNVLFQISFAKLALTLFNCFIY